MNNSVLLTILVLLAIGYVFLYFGGRKYLEAFQNIAGHGQPPVAGQPPTGKPNVNANNMFN